MNTIFESYQETISEKMSGPGPSNDGWMDRKTSLTADMASSMLDGGMIPRKFNHNWWEIANMFGYGDVEPIRKADQKKFLADLENLGMDSTDAEKNIDKAMFKKYMKAWI